MTAAILAARRSAVCPSGGAFKDLSIEDIAAPVIASVLADGGLGADAVGELIVGNALGAGGNPARRIALAAGLPEHVGGLSLDRQCVSGLDAIRIGAAMVESGQAKVVIAGGVESHSTRPIRADRRTGAVYEQAPFTPWPERDPDVIEAAAALAQRLGIRRADCDAYAMESHARARAAQAELAAEIVAVGGVTEDRFTRPLSPALAARARTLTAPVSAGNMAVAADGAAFCLVVDAAMAGPEAPRILASATRGATPEDPALAALPAIAEVLGQTGLTPGDLASIDLMEAFAVQALATIAAADLPAERVNPAGGALARGHPIGASGAIGAVRAFHELRHRGGPVMTAIPAAGGLGSAMILSPK